MNDYQIDRLSDITADLAKGLFLSGFGSVIINNSQSLLILMIGAMLGILFTLFSIKILDFKIS